MESTIDRALIATILCNAFRFHLASGFRPYGNTQSRAALALSRARADIAAGNIRYPAPIRGNAMRGGFDQDKPQSVFVENPAAHGLRFVGRVAADTPRGEIWDKRESSGWYADSYQDRLIYGVVFQIPAHKGQSRFVAGYMTSDDASGALIDFSTVYTSVSGKGGTWGSAQDDDDARDAARAADSMAQHVAEEEREYSTAWQAGAQWADEQEAIREARQEALAILRERRAVKGQPGFPALCKAIRAQVESLLETIQEARAKAAKLASGEYGELYFWQGDKRLQGAFCEGAEIQSFPA